MAEYFYMTHSPFPPYGPNISLENARIVLKASIANASELQLGMAVAIVDTGGHLVAFERINNTHVASTIVAQDKARSAATFRRSTKVFQDAVAGGGEGLRVLTMSGACAVEGGLPILHQGRIIGGIGVSGGTPVQDGDVAQVGANAALVDD